MTGILSKKAAACLLVAAACIEGAPLTARQSPDVAPFDSNIAPPSDSDGRQVGQAGAAPLDNNTMTVPPQADTMITSNTGGHTIGFLDTLDCPAADIAYLEANNDVLQTAKSTFGFQGSDADALNDPRIQNTARQHWLNFGRNQRRNWPGRKCIDETFFCWSAQQQYWADVPEAANSDQYGPDLLDPRIPGGATYLGQGHSSTVPRNGAWLHFQQNKDTNSALYWRGDLCAKYQYYHSGSWYECDKSARDYVLNSPDILARGSYRGRAIGDPNGSSFNAKAAINDYMNYGQAEGRPYNKFLCYN